MSDTSHLVAIHERLGRERARLASAQTDGERVLRAVWVEQAEREFAAELRFLGMDDSPLPTLSDDDILAELDLL